MNKQQNWRMPLQKKDNTPADISQKAHIYPPSLKTATTKENPLEPSSQTFDNEVGGKLTPLCHKFILGQAFLSRNGDFVIKIQPFPRVRPAMIVCYNNTTSSHTNNDSLIRL